MKKSDIDKLERAPIVVVLGHVDHGKTSLLDTIRKTNVTSKEAGGITQSIGASVVETKSGKKITFIDTPGHAAFTKMRGRGAKVADIAVLVIAQDDGVKPQTKEAIDIIKESDIPFIVAATKSDVAGVNVETALSQLEKEEIFFEGRGGQTPYVSVSAKNGSGIDELIETIVLFAEVNDVTGDPDGEIDAFVIESGKEKMGPYATVVVRNGTIKVGEVVYAEESECKVRAIFDETGKSVKQILPGEPGKILGFSSAPQVGAIVSSEPKKRTEVVVEVKKGFSRKLADDQLPVIIRALNEGSLEAIIQSLPEKVVVIDSGTGDVTTSDIIQAKTGDSYIFAFESKIPSSVKKLAEAEKVNVERYEIIYELLERVEEILSGGKLEVLGKAEVLASFPFNDKKVAGCKMLEGKITKGDKLTIMRGEKELGVVRAASLKKQKQDVGQVGQGEEFGVIFEPQTSFEIGDFVFSYKK